MNGHQDQGFYVFFLLQNNTNEFGVSICISIAEHLYVSVLNYCKLKFLSRNEVFVVIHYEEKGQTGLHRYFVGSDRTFDRTFVNYVFEPTGFH